VLYFRHAFDEAAVEATRAIALDPHDSHAYGILGDAELEVGKYAEAEHAYTRMIGLDADLSALSRLSGLKALRGDRLGAIADLEQAIDAGQMEGRPSESIAWAQWQLGAEHFNLGDLEAAEAAYTAALATYPRYHRALAGLAQVRSAQGHPAEAVTLYEHAIGIIPQPDYVAALGDVFAKMGRPDAARRQYALVEYIGRLSVLNRVLYNRELASFYADHDTKLGEALDLARRELDVRQDIYGYDVLAWVLYKNGQPGAAREAMVEALRLGTRDARLFFHAGMIERRLGHREAARNYLQSALATNPYFHLFQADEARRALTELEAPPPRAGGPVPSN
jgi:tetratricopeptide (TPR) repeat protein